MNGLKVKAIIIPAIFFILTIFFLILIPLPVIDTEKEGDYITTTTTERKFEFNLILGENIPIDANDFNNDKPIDITSDDESFEKEVTTLHGDSIVDGDLIGISTPKGKDYLLNG